MLEQYNEIILQCPKCIIKDMLHKILQIYLHGKLTISGSFMKSVGKLEILDLEGLKDH